MTPALLFEDEVLLCRVNDRSVALYSYIFEEIQVFDILGAAMLLLIVHSGIYIYS